ncbi:MAG: hypothetical protein V7727_03300 [Sneathiella sp.]
MTTLTDYDYSILALDTYYDRGVIGTPQAVNEALTSSYGLTAVQTATDVNGFSATVYKASDNDYIISYTGLNGGADYDDCVLLGAGVVPAQFTNAMALYNDVLADVILAGGDASKISLTGHSMGGGLASMVSAVTGADAVVTDPAPSKTAIGNIPISDGTVVPGYESNITVYRVEGSILENAFLESSIAGTITMFDLPVINEDYYSLNVLTDLHSSMLNALFLSKESGATYDFVELAAQLTKIIPALSADELTDLSKASTAEFGTGDYLKKLMYAGPAHVDALYNDLSLLTDQATGSLNVSFDNDDANQGLIQLAVQYSRLRVDQAGDNFYSAAQLFTTSEAGISVDLKALTLLDGFADLPANQQIIFGKDTLSVEFFENAILQNYHSGVNAGLIAVAVTALTASIAADGHETLIIESNGQAGVVIAGTDDTTGNGSDMIISGVGNDVITGLGGNDHINALSGHDDIDGGAGNDVLLGGNGSDFIAGGEGNDFVFGGAGDDYIFDQFGGDTLDGGEGDDWLIGGSDAKGPAQTQLTGADYAGGTTFVFGSGYGQDVIDVTGMDPSQAVGIDQYNAGMYNNSLVLKDLNQSDITIKTGYFDHGYLPGDTWEDGLETDSQYITRFQQWAVIEVNGTDDKIIIPAFATGTYVEECYPAGTTWDNSVDSLYYFDWYSTIKDIEFADGTKIDFPQNELIYETVGLGVEDDFMVVDNDDFDADLWGALEGNLVPASWTDKPFEIDDDSSYLDANYGLEYGADWIINRLNEVDPESVDGNGDIAGGGAMAMAMAQGVNMSAMPSTPMVAPVAAAPVEPAPQDPEPVETASADNFNFASSALEPVPDEISTVSSSQSFVSGSDEITIDADAIGNSDDQTQPDAVDSFAFDAENDLALSNSQLAALDNDVFTFV